MASDIEVLIPSPSDRPTYIFDFANVSRTCLWLMVPLPNALISSPVCLEICFASFKTDQLAE